MFTTIRVQLLVPESRLLCRYVSLLSRHLTERGGVRITDADEAELTIQLAYDEAIGAEGYSIDDTPHGAIRISGHDPRGLLYGIGKFLHTSEYDEGAFAPTRWRGTSRPTRAFRGIYFASHFYNFYHQAPLEEIARYLEDLALWGYNGVTVWFDMHHYQGMDDPAAQDMLVRLRGILTVAREIGLWGGLMVLGNEAYAGSPPAMRADWRTGQHGYRDGVELSHYHVELCPQKAGARDYLLTSFEQLFRSFADQHLEFLSIWPYDQGGCTCADCAPWGARGFLNIAPDIAALFRRVFPGAKISLSTWYFDRAYPNEWEAFARAFDATLHGADYIMADAMGDDVYPQYPLKHGVPGGLPLLNFPEISMYANWPWGGYGMNPYPHRLQELWEMSKSLLVGGLPYSEGIFEDINKVVCAQFYWNDRPAVETVRDYISYYFGHDIVFELSRAVALMERTLAHHYDATTPTHVTMPETEGVEETFDLVKKAEEQMTSYARKNWRWRLFFLRAFIDLELAAHNMEITELCDAAFRELISIYHAQHAAPSVRPPALEEGFFDNLHQQDDAIT